MRFTILFGLMPLLAFAAPVPVTNSIQRRAFQEQA